MPFACSSPAFVFFSASYNTRLGLHFCESGALELWRKRQIYGETDLCYYYTTGSPAAITVGAMVVSEGSFKRELFLTAIFNNWEDTVRKLLENNPPEIFRNKNERGLERV